MSTIVAPFTSSPGPTIRSLTIASLRSGEYKIVPSTATNGKDGGSTGGGCRADVTGVAAVVGAFKPGRAGAASIGLAGTIGVGLAGAAAGAAAGATPEVTRAAAGAGTDALVTDCGDGPAGVGAGGFGTTVAADALLAVVPVPGEAGVATGVATEPAGKTVAWGGLPAVTTDPAGD